MKSAIILRVPIVFSAILVPWDNRILELLVINLEQSTLVGKPFVANYWCRSVGGQVHQSSPLAETFFRSQTYPSSKADIGKKWKNVYKDSISAPPPLHRYIFLFQLNPSSCQNNWTRLARLLTQSTNFVFVTIGQVQWPLALDFWPLLWLRQHGLNHSRAN